MNRELFLSKLSEKDVPNSPEDIQAAINKFLLFHQDLDGENRYAKSVIVEECAELTQAITKDMRDSCDRVNILEEAADVAIVLEYVKRIYDISDGELSRAVSVKTDRMVKLMNDWLILNDEPLDGNYYEIKSRRGDLKTGR